MTPAKAEDDRGTQCRRHNIPLSSNTDMPAPKHNPLFVYRLTIVYDAGPSLNQHRVKLQQRVCLVPEKT